MNCLLIIPAYNEEDCILPVVEEIRENFPSYDFVIVNDGSTDATAELCRLNHYRFIDLPVNLGLTGAFQAGVKYAVRHGYDCAIQFDADGQHCPDYLDSLVAALEQSDVVIGSRFLDAKKPNGMKKIGSNLISSIIRLTTGQRIQDPTSGMRAYSRRVLEELASGPNLGPEPDTLAYLMRKKNVTVTEVPVKMRSRVAGESYLNMRSSSAYMFRMTLSVLFIQFFR